MNQPSLFDDPVDPPGEPAERPADQPARDFAVDPRNDVVLEASAGTGKTRVLVNRYVRLLLAGVDPRHILAVTFTRKAAAEMRDRVLATLRREAAAGLLDPDVWRTVQARLHDVQITTIDAFCFGLLREFPLEAGIDPTFEIAEETETARFASEALDTALRAARARVATDEPLRLLFVRVKPTVLRATMATLIDRRQVALPAVRAFVRRHPAPTTAAEAGDRFLARVQAELPSDLREALIDDGPQGAAGFRGLADDLVRLDQFPAADQVQVHRLRRRLEAHFLTKGGTPRQRLDRAFTTDQFASAAARRRHEHAVRTVAPGVVAALEALDADLDALLARGLLHLLTIAVSIYDRLLAEHALLDFAGMLDRAVGLLSRQEEFARSRLKLQSRYHHLLVDEFQDTSRQQWRLVELLIDAWAEGEGAADASTSIFVVGDRKQSIYRFRHAEATLLDVAARRIGALRGRNVRQVISTSFRAVPELLAFVNALSADMVGDEDIPDRWEYRDVDRFPAPVLAAGARRDGRPVLGLIAQASMEQSAAAVADEVVRLLATGQVRDRGAGTRPIRRDDIAILFRARAGHQYFEDALERRGVRTYVYKGLGFFDAPEVQDLQALLRFLARPDSELRTAEFLRSRLVRLSDPALALLAPHLSRAVLASDAPRVPLDTLDAALLDRVRTDVRRWLALAHRVPPGELLDVILRESAYVSELRGRRLDQARENIKKLRSLVRRVENRGYVTIDRLASYFETLRAGDDSNAVVRAADAVNLMTIHAAKGLEFPIVFLVNLHAPGRGRPAGFSVIEHGPDGEPEVTFGTTAATRLEDRRDVEELRRLLYVATTRARDRLYLAAEVDRQGRLRRGHRSLAALLPASLAERFAEAHATPGDEVEWVTSHGTFAMSVCRPVETSTDLPVHTSVLDAPVRPLPVMTTLTFGGLAIQPASLAWAADPERSPAPAVVPASPRRDTRLVGTIVHRMLQRRCDPAQDDDRLRDEALALLTMAERADVGEPEDAVRQAVDLFRSVLKDDAVSGLLAVGTAYYEVPFSFLPPEQPNTCLRGVVDCLVKAPDGSMEILEFKTGQPRPEHETQLALYLRAMKAVFGEAITGGRICYPGGSLRILGGGQSPKKPQDPPARKL